MAGKRHGSEGNSGRLGVVPLHTVSKLTVDTVTTAKGEKGVWSAVMRGRGHEQFRWREEGVTGGRQLASAGDEVWGVATEEERKVKILPRGCCCCRPPAAPPAGAAGRGRGGSPRSPPTPAPP